jgi:hypothetical protein
VHKIYPSAYIKVGRILNSLIKLLLVW